MEKQKRFCSECGRQCTVNDKFCPDCGKSLALDGETMAQSTDTKINVVTNVSETKEHKKGVLAGFILMVIGVVYLLGEILTHLGLIKSTLEADIGSIICAISFCIFGLILVKKSIKKYGWGIAAVVFGSAAIGACYPFDKFRLLGNLVICAVFAYLLFKANRKNKGEK